MDEYIYDFLVKRDNDSFKLIDKYITDLCAKVLWIHWHQQNYTKQQEAKSYVTHKLLASTGLSYDNLTGYLYSMVKAYYMESDFKIQYTDDLSSFERLYHQEENQDDFIDYKIDLVHKLTTLLKSSFDKNSLLVLSALIEVIKTETDYENKFLSLYLYRSTRLSHYSLCSVLKNLKLVFPISNPKSLQNILKLYVDALGEQNSTGKLIEDWEREAIKQFGNHHERSKGIDYDLRRNPVAKRKTIKSTSTERIGWLNENRDLNPSNLFFQYANRFGMSYTSFKSDRREAKLVVI